MRGHQLAPVAVSLNSSMDGFGGTPLIAVFVLGWWLRMVSVVIGLLVSVRLVTVCGCGSCMSRFLHALKLFLL